MTDRAAARQRKKHSRANLRARGLTEYSVICYPEDKPAIKRYAEELRKEHEEPMAYCQKCEKVVVATWDRGDLLCSRCKLVL